MVSEQADLSRIIDGHVRIRGHRVHVLSNDDAQRTEHGEVQGQLGMPAVDHELEQAVMALRCREKQGITFLSLEDLLDGVTDPPVGPVHVAGHDEQHRDGQVVMSDIGHPHASGHRIDPAPEGEEIAICSPVAVEEGTDACIESRIELGQKTLIKEFVRKRDVCHGSDGLAVQHQRLAGIDGIHQLGCGQRHMQQVTCPGQ